MWASDTDTEHPTQTTQHVGFRHRHTTSHTDNTARGLQTQTHNIPHRQHSTCVSDTDTEHPTQHVYVTQTQNIPHRQHSTCTSDTENTACMRQTQTKNTAHVCQRQKQHMSSDTDHPTQRTQHMCITHREHSMGCQTQTENTACTVRHWWRTQNVLSDTDITACVHQTGREHSMCCQTQRTQYVCVSDTDNTAHVVRHSHRPQYIWNKEHSTCASDTDHPTKRTMRIYIRHRQWTLHIWHRPQRMNIRHKEKTQHLNIRPREHSIWTSDQENTASVCVRHRQHSTHTSETEITAYVGHIWTENEHNAAGWMDGSMRQWMNGWKTEIKQKQNKTKLKKLQSPAGSSLLQEDQIRWWLQSCWAVGSFTIRSFQFFYTANRIPLANQSCACMVHVYDFQWCTWTNI